MRSLLAISLFLAAAGWADAAGRAERGALRGRIPLLVDGLEEPDTRADSRAALVALGREATPLLLEYFSDPRFTVRWEMVNIQGILQDRRAIDAVVQRVLVDESSHVRWRGLWALSAQSTAGRARAIKSLETALAADDSRAWNAAVGLAHFGVPTGLPLLHSGLDDPDAWRRWEAVHALARVHDETSSTRLTGILESGSPRERREAVISLGHVGDAAAVATLSRLLDHPETALRWRAVQALGRAGAVGALPRLLDMAAADPDETVRRQAAQASRHMGAPSRASNGAGGVGERQHASW